MAGKVEGGGPLLPPQQPVNTNETVRAPGKLGDKNVTAHEAANYLNNQPKSSLTGKSLADYSISATDELSRSNLDMLAGLFNSSEWSAAGSAVNLHVKTLEQHQQLSEKLTSHIPDEGKQILTDHFATLAAQSVTETLSDIPGTPAEQLDVLNMFFNKPGTAENPVGAIAREKADEFLENRGYDKNLRKSLVEQLEKEVFVALDELSQQLDDVVFQSGDSQQVDLAKQQQRQRLLELRELASRG